MSFRNYTFDTLGGKTSLSELFGDHDQLLVIHNMGQACRYCTLWADGVNGLLPHLEDALSVVFVSKDPPAVQRRLANSRGWRFRQVSHAGGPYIGEQTVVKDADNMPAQSYTNETANLCVGRMPVRLAPAISIARPGVC